MLMILSPSAEQHKAAKLKRCKSKDPDTGIAFNASTGTDSTCCTRHRRYRIGIDTARQGRRCRCRFRQWCLVHCIRRAWISLVPDQVTTGLAAAFFGTSLILFYLAAHRDGGISSVTDSLPAAIQEETSTTNNNVDTDLPVAPSVEGSTTTGSESGSDVPQSNTGN